MPIYEYQCEPCRIIYETMHGIEADHHEALPQMRRRVGHV